jgi:hypothetical protein
MAAKQEALSGMESLVKRTTAETLADVIQKAIFDPSFDPTKLRVLMEMQIQWEDREKKCKFDEALESFRSNRIVIEKTKQVLIPVKSGEKPIEYWHAELDKAADIVTEALLAVGLTYTWRPDVGPEGKPKMALVLRGFGHTEEMGGLVGPPDLSGGKNAMQAIGSSTSYLARYVLLFSLGIVAKGLDDDGRSATGGIPEQSILEYCTAITDAHGFEESKKVFTEAWNKAAGCSDEPAQMRFLKVFNEKKKKLAEAKNGRQ